MATLIEEVYPRARKRHWCGHCGEPIEPGTCYVRQRCAEGREAWTWKGHLFCDALWDDLRGYNEIFWEVSDVLDAVEVMAPERYRAIYPGEEEASRRLWFWVRSRPEVRDDQRLLPSLAWFCAQAASVGVAPTREDRTRFASMVVDRFNDLGDENEAVFYVDDRGHEHRTRTGSRAWLLGGHTPVVLLQGVSGACMLERVTPCKMREEEENAS